MKINIKKIVATWVIGVAAVFGVGISSTSAAPYSYYDYDVFASGGQLIASGSSYTGNFNLTLSNVDGDGDLIGYNPLSQQLIWAAAEFQIKGVGDVTSEVEVKVGAEQMTSFYFDGVFSFVFGDIISGYMFLNDNGFIDYKLINNSTSDIRLNRAALDAEAGDKQISVPDTGSSFALLGISAVAFWALRRRMRVMA